MNWNQRTVWITGASSGIGEALAGEIGRRGGRMILSGRRADALAQTAAQTDAETLVLPFEATDYAALPSIVEQARSWTGSIDVLINNAGIGQRSLAVDTDFDVYRRLMEIDFFAPVRLTQLVLPDMTARRSGHIVVVNSLSGKIGGPLRTGYAAAKHACQGYFEALRSEVERTYGIDILLVYPGFVRTAIALNALSGDGSRHGQADVNIAGGLDPVEVATAIADAIGARKREIAIADTFGTDLLAMRAQDPEALFDLLGIEGEKAATMVRGTED